MDKYVIKTLDNKTFWVKNKDLPDILSKLETRKFIKVDRAIINVNNISGIYEYTRIAKAKSDEFFDKAASRREIESLNKRMKFNIEKE